MKNKNLKTLVLIISLFILPNFALALEATYPVILGLPIITQNSTIPELIRYFFGIGIYFSGAIALISLAIAGVQLIIGQANPEGVSNAKDRIKGSLLGIVLLMASFIIIKSINPVLLEPSITPITAGPGIYFVKGNNQTTAITASNVSDIPPEFMGGNIEYRCPNPTTDPKLLIWTYNNKNLDSSGGANTIEIDCEGSLPIPPIGSYKIAYKTPGIYIYKDSGCNSYRSDVITTSGEIIEEFKKREPTEFRCVEIINDPINKIYYGAILHSGINENGGGLCQTPLIYDPLSLWYQKQVSIDTLSSITVFNINDDPKTSGDGIQFFSAPYGWNTGAKTGALGYKDIFKTKYYSAQSPDIMKFTNFFDMTTQEQAVAQNFGMKQGSIEIRGNYLVVIYSNPPSSATGIPQNGYCQIFRSNVVDLNGTEFKSKDGGHTIKVVYMFATK